MTRPRSWRSGWRLEDRLAFPRLRWLRHDRLLVVATLALHVLWLALLDRSLVCPCGVVSLWQFSDDPAQNSQQVADAYSLLHVVFGMGLYLVFTWLRPRWPRIDRAMLALISSTAWEIVENTPGVIALLNNATNAAPDYHGDSILNSLADTGFAMLGFAIAARLPLRWILALALALELVVSLRIHDGFLLAGGRLVFGLFGQGG
ncbi:DUF2585 family protein [Luteimonas sp. TWI662]|uniref:DUF2585 family protein n=1 Tax=Luteimonas sp. TWI662 TaxID=3136789 RepID=UPI003207BC6B